MAMYCTTCGKKFDVDTAYCTDCGANLAQAKSTVVEPPAFEPTPRATVATVPSAVRPAPTATNETNSGVVGTGTYFGLMFLFGIPLIGFIACILMCFIPKNKNIKNYAKAQLIWSIISLVVTLLLVILVSTAVTAAMNYVQAALPSPLADLFDQVGGLDMLKMLMQADDLGDLKSMLGQVDLSQLDMAQLQPLLEQLGVSDLSELQPLLEQLGVSDFSELQPLLEQLGVNDLGELSGMLEQLGVDDVNELSNLIDRYDIENMDDLSNLAAQW